jgi:tetratricopeptide (TPR) repeat protein
MKKIKIVRAVPRSPKGNGPVDRLLTISCAMALLLSCSTPKIDPGATARLYGSRALPLFTEGNFTGAIKEYQKAYVHAARADLPIQQAQYLFNIGRVWYEAGELDSADQALQAAYREFSYYKDSTNA